MRAHVRQLKGSALFLLPLFALAACSQSDTQVADVAAPPPEAPPLSRFEVPKQKCFVTIDSADGEQVVTDLELWEYADTNDPGRAVCSFDPSVEEGLVLEETPNAILIDTGGCTGWIAKDFATEVRCVDRD